MIDVAFFLLVSRLKDKALESLMAMDSSSPNTRAEEQTLATRLICNIIWKWIPLSFQNEPPK